MPGYPINKRMSRKTSGSSYCVIHKHSPSFLDQGSKNLVSSSKYTFVGFAAFNLALWFISAVRVVSTII